jgi:isopentenyl-diphosphate delta-isomerase
MDIRQFEDRKREHIRHSLDPAHQAIGLGGLDRVRLPHDALPELDLEQVELSTPCLGRTLRTPYYVAGMTAGHADAPELNGRLARACQRRGWAMGVGSQRRELVETSSVDGWRRLRDEVPELVLLANVGVTQLVTTPLARVRGLVDSIRAQALVVHANALQEALQPEGTPRFRGALEALRTACSELGVPVVLKETGCGFSPRTLEKIAGIGLAAVDVSGLGGTHWGRIEGARAGGVLAGAAETFADWGVPTAESVAAAAGILGAKTEIWASGGVRSGLDAAKLIALGAHRVGYAKPALEAALAGDESLDRWMERQELELRVALFCTGSAMPSTLRGTVRL